jgi:Fic family protein
MHYVWQNTNWTEFSWESDALIQPLGRARLRQGRLLSKADALGLKFGKEARVEILIEEAVKTAAIEGQALHRDSVRSSVARRLGLPTAGLPAAERVVDGLVDVLLDATANYSEPLSPERLMGWQAALFPRNLCRWYPALLAKKKSTLRHLHQTGWIWKSEISFNGGQRDRKILRDCCGPL